jgi:very-short-patch-repair endonuclease
VPNPAYSKVVYSRTGSIEENFELLHERDFDGSETKTKGFTILKIENNELTENIDEIIENIQATDSEESSELKKGRAEPLG